MPKTTELDMTKRRNVFSLQFTNCYLNQKQN